MSAPPAAARRPPARRESARRAVPRRAAALALAGALGPFALPGAAADGCTGRGCNGNVCGVHGSVCGPNGCEEEGTFASLNRRLREFGRRTRGGLRLKYEGHLRDHALEHPQCPPYQVPAWGYHQTCWRPFPERDIAPCPPAFPPAEAVGRSAYDGFVPPAPADPPAPVYPAPAPVPTPAGEDSPESDPNLNLPAGPADAPAAIPEEPEPSVPRLDPFETPGEAALPPVFPVRPAAASAGHVAPRVIPASAAAPVWDAAPAAPPAAAPRTGTPMPRYVPPRRLTTQPKRDPRYF